jgi:hypothetical protein
MDENDDCQDMRVMHSAAARHPIFMAEILRLANGSTGLTRRNVGGGKADCAKAGFDANHLRADSAETGAIGARPERIDE